MASVDDRVVRMSFENAAFEKGVATTLGTLGELNSAISNVGSKNGLSQLSAMDKGFSLGGVSSAIEGVSASFVAMSTVAITALANITNRAVDAGISLGKSLTLDPITDGFAEYELNMNSIQTVLANTKKDGTNLQDVNEALDGLNEYSDLTIYNFAQMAKNIGSATAAGVDLDTATTYVKGFANSAAVAGVDAGAMAGGLEQMSQALGSGVIKAQDWISLEKRGLAGQVQQQAFFDMAKAMGTLADVPADQSFKEWTDAGNTLRGSLKDGWLTAEVFTNTMGVFAGEMDEAKLASLGFTDEMIPGALELGETAVDAATKVRTLSQLMDTTQEAVASGWMESFRTVVGDFDEATDLFTNISSKTGEIIGRSAERRNKLLSEWKELGGRADLIEGFRASFSALGNVITLVKGAFRGIFPRKSAEDWARYTEVFKDMALGFESLTEEGLKLKGPFGAMRTIFSQFFRILKSIGSIIWAVVSGFAGMVKELVPLGGGKALENVRDFLAFIADALAKIDTNKITDFFKGLTKLIQAVIPVLQEGYRAVRQFIEGLDFSGVGDFFASIISSASGVSFDTSAFDNFGNVVGGAFDNLRLRLGYFSKAFDFFGDVWDKFLSGMSSIKDTISNASNAVGDFFDQLGGGMGDAVEAAGSDNDSLFDTLAALFFGGLAAGFVRFLNKGFDVNLDFGGGLFDRLEGTLKGVNGVLKGMQADLKAGALLKIAAAIGVLAVSITLLSFINPEDLAKAMAAIAVGFGQLAGALTVLNRIEFSATEAAKFALMALSFGILSASLVLLGLAMKIYATMSWEEIGKGSAVLAGVIGGIILMSKTLENEAKGMIKASAAMLLLSLSMGSMFKVIKKFGELDMAVLIQGFAAVAASMAFLVTAMNKLPKDLEKRTAGMLGFGLALNLMVVAIKLLGAMDLGELVQGGVAFAGMLGLLVLAMNKMPTNMGVQASQLLALSGAILIMSVAMKAFGSMGWEEIARGLAVMAGSLALMVLAMNLASGGIAGAGAMLVMSTSLLLLAAAIRGFAAMDFTDFLKGLFLMASGIAAIAGVAMLLYPALPALLGLGAALALLGIGIAAIGFGASQVARAIVIMSKIGAEGAEALIAVLEAVGKALPALLTGFALGIIEMGKVILSALPVLIKGLGGALGAFLDLIIGMIPKVRELMGELLSAFISVVFERAGELALAGLELLLTLMQGIRDNIAEIVTLALEILAAFMDGFASGIGGYVDSLVNLILETLSAVAEGVGKLVPQLMPTVGTAFIRGFIEGLESQWSTLKAWFGNLVKSVINWIKSGFGIFSPSRVMKDIGLDLMQGLINGLVKGVVAITKWFRALPGNVLRWIGTLTSLLVSKGQDIITGLYTGIGNFVTQYLYPWVSGLGGKIFGWIGTVSGKLVSKGWDFIKGIYTGIGNYVTQYLDPWFSGLGDKIFGWIGGVSGKLVSKGWDFIKGIYTGIGNFIDEYLFPWASGLPERIKGWIGSTYTSLKYVGRNLIIGLWNGINDKVQWVKDRISGFADGIKDWFEDKFWIGSPSRWFAWTGEMMMLGLGKGLEDNANKPTSAMDQMSKALIETVNKGVDDAYASLDNAGVFSPTIAPVLDLSSVKKGARSISKLVDVDPKYSVAQASAISTMQNTGRAKVDNHATGSTEIKFEQTINAPKQLSTGDIYRQTRNQITMAKDELRIP